MCRRGGLWLVIVLSALGGGVWAETPEELLRRSDVATAGPQSFRAVLRVTADQKAIALEVWRSGENRTLVRFLAPKERGKYLLRLDSTLWFLSPGAKNPVKLAPSYKLKGSASLDDLLGIRYSRDYEIVSFGEEPDASGPLAVFDLRARGKALYPRVRYLVRTATARPLRAEYRLASGKLASVVEFAEWDGTQRLRFRRLVFRDQLRNGAVTDVELMEMEERTVPTGLFDLQDAGERWRVFGGAERPRPNASPSVAR
jgi:hypothetical protein